jgi:hypothetical protein
MIDYEEKPLVERYKKKINSYSHTDERIWKE